MTIIVEDGTGTAGAESYVSAADADLYHINRGNTGWPDLDADVKEQALRRAADFMVGTYRGRWKGYRAQLTQSLDWPRKAVILTDTSINYQIPFNQIPVEVKNAQCELALRTATSTNLAPDLTQNVLHESVGSLQTSYDRYTSQSPRFRQVDIMLRHLLTNMGASSPLTRT